MHMNDPNERAWSWWNDEDVWEWETEADAIVMKNLPNASEEIQQEYKESFFDAGPEDGVWMAEEKLEEYKLSALMKESINFGK